MSRIEQSLRNAVGLAVIATLTSVAVAASAQPDPEPINLQRPSAVAGEELVELPQSAGSGSPTILATHRCRFRDSGPVGNQLAGFDVANSGLARIDRIDAILPVGNPAPARPFVTIDLEADFLNVTDGMFSGVARTRCLELPSYGKSASLLDCSTGLEQMALGTYY